MSHHKAANAARELTRLRLRARALVLEEGTALAPGASTSEQVTDLIGELVERLEPAFDRATRALYERIPDRDLEIAVSDRAGALMNAYGDAGYFVGLSVGMELARLTLGDTGPAVRATPRRKGGAR